MGILHQKLICTTLAGAMTLSSLGCVTTIEHPTQATIRNYVRAGDEVEVVMQSGAKRKFEVVSVTATGIQAAEQGQAIAYADMQALRFKNEITLGNADMDGQFNLGNGGNFNMQGADPRAILIVIGCVVVVVVVVACTSMIVNAKKHAPAHAMHCGS